MPYDCPRCGHGSTAGTAARLICTACGLDWQVPSLTAPMPREPDADSWDHGDDLSTLSLPFERLRTWYVAPPTEAERAAARRFLDGLAEPC